MKSNPSPYPLRLRRSSWASSTKSEPHRMKLDGGPHDLPLDPQNSQIKSIRHRLTITYVLVSEGLTDQEQGVCRGIPVVPSYTPLHAIARPVR